MLAITENSSAVNTARHGRLGDGLRRLEDYNSAEMSEGAWKRSEGRKMKEGMRRRRETETERRRERDGKRKREREKEKEKTERHTDRNRYRHRETETETETERERDRARETETHRERERQYRPRSVMHESSTSYKCPYDQH